MSQLEIILSEMFRRVGDTYSSDKTKDNFWYYAHEWTESEERDFVDWLTEYLYNNKEARKELMAFPTKNKNRCDRVSNYFVLWYGWKYKK
jgi:hypothetical protein